ncbi:MAG TPA: glycosyltransferase, partial [Saprospiraceae bacterium]|nr:glycosyltransferase [Saprospiraceae bacterium]
REGLPRIVIEGMAMKKPVITTNTAGCRQTVINCENGFLINIKDTESLKNAVEKFIHLSPEKKELLGTRGRDIVLSKFDSNKIADKIYDLIKVYL